MSPKIKNIVSIVLCGLLTLALVGAGVSKLMGQEEQVQNFARWGYPPFFLYLIGFSQVVLAIALWFKNSRKWAALGIVAIFIGAVGTHILANEMNHLFAPVVILAMSSGVYFLNRS